MPVAAWIWFRAGRRRWMLAAFASGLVAQAAWLAAVAANGLDAILAPTPQVGFTGWAAWALGIGGVAGLVSGMRGATETGRTIAQSDRAMELSIGFFGLGVLLQQLARTF
jgi:hypothetical protein